MEKKKNNDLQHIFGDIKKHFLNGVSYMLPVVVAGGVLMAIALAMAGGITIPESGFIHTLYNIGVTSLGLMVPVLSAYIAFSIAERSALAAGFVGGLISNEIGAGFLGGLLSGIIAGAIVYYLKKIKFSINFKSMGSIIIIPLISVTLTGLIMYYVIGEPVAGIMHASTNFLTNVSEGNKVILGIVMGAMLAFDMGGPINKVVFSLMVATIGDGIFTLAGPISVGIVVPPLGCALATIIAKNKFTQEEREAGKSAFIMGLVGITEGAIPFAAADPLRVIPSLMIGNAVGVTTAYLLNVQSHAAWGGMITLPVIENKLGFIIAQIVGMVATALLLIALKKPVTEAVSKDEEDEDIDLDFNF